VENWGISGNVVENKGTYEFKAGMLLKRKDVGGRRYVVGGEKQGPGVRCQVVGGSTAVLQPTIFLVSLLPETREPLIAIHPK
jgi:hypothetical protein